MFLFLFSFFYFLFFPSKFCTGKIFELIGHFIQLSPSSLSFLRPFVPPWRTKDTDMALIKVQCSSNPENYSNVVKPKLNWKPNTTSPHLQILYSVSNSSLFNKIDFSVLNMLHYLSFEYSQLISRWGHLQAMQSS